MTHEQRLSQLVTSYRFSDVVKLWAREKLEHEDIVSRVLARGVVCDGLRLQSVDGRWMQQGGQPVVFRGYPYVGYAARPEGGMSILRASALEHLFSVVERGVQPQLELLSEEFIEREDFRSWLLSLNLALPKFWFE